MLKKKKCICLLCIISILFTNMNVYASNNKNEINNFINIEEMKKISENSLTMNSDTYVNIQGCHSFTPYVQSMFSQENSCGPVAAANILSYYHDYKGINLYNGDITQSIFNQICTDCKWSPNGTNMVNVSDGIKTFCTRAGKTCNIDTYMLNLWTDVTRDIGRNKPILLAYDGHFYMVLGYAIVNNEKYLYVLTGLDGDTPIYANLKWSSGFRMRSIEIY